MKRTLTVSTKRIELLWKARLMRVSIRRKRENSKKGKMKTG